MVGEILKQLRNNHRMTQAQVSELLNMERSTYTYYERGRMPSVETIIKLSKLYHVTTDYLLFGREESGKLLLSSPASKMEAVASEEDSANAAPGLELSADERRLVYLYRICEDQAEVLETVRALSIQNGSAE